MLDTLARTFLWELGLDYAHGTGHGVGAFLNVHEGNNILCHTLSQSLQQDHYREMSLILCQITGKHFSFKGKSNMYAWFYLFTNFMIVICCRAVWNQSPSFSG